MGIKSYNPYTPSRRHMTGSDFSEITKSTPEKSLTVSLKKNAGRNNQGKITVRHRGGGSRRKYRIIDFKRRKDGIPATVVSIEYDPNRTANIALISYVDGEKAYILAPEGLKVGQKVMNGAVPADAAAFTLLKEQLVEVLSTLTDREQKVLRLRFGLDDGRARTLEEVGKEFNVTRERIRQIEAKALRKLRHPSRSRKLKDYLDY